MSKLAETFGIPLTDIESSIDELEEDTNNFENVGKFVEEFKSTLTETEMTELVDLGKYDSEMDEISSKTLSEFEDLVIIAKDVDPRHCGEILSAAAQMAKIALDARTNKTNARLKILELAIRRKRNDLLEKKQDFEINGANQHINGKVLTSRSELLDMIDNIDLQKVPDKK